MVEAVDRARNGGGPTLVEAKTYRFTPHSSDDDDRTYRPREEVEEYKKRDPLTLTQKYLVSEGFLSDEIIEKMETKAKEAVEDAVKFADSTPYPDPDEGAHPVYAEGGEPCL
jgi:2-oxoisovalerate dehydrogenase E1 component alpha subunit